jgi:hypothetical protein
MQLVTQVVYKEKEYMLVQTGYLEVETNDWTDTDEVLVIDMSLWEEIYPTSELSYRLRALAQEENRWKLNYADEWEELKGE